MLYWRANSYRLEPEFFEDVLTLLHNSPYHWYVIYGYRSLEEQRILYNKYLTTGKNKAAPPGASPHNYGLAVDVVLDIDPNTKGLQPSWNTKLLGWLWLFLKIKLHKRLKSGILFGDGGHIEKVNWKAYKESQLTRIKYGG